MLTVYFKLIITIHCPCAYAMNCILDIASYSPHQSLKASHVSFRMNCS